MKRTVSTLFFLGVLAAGTVFAGPKYNYINSIGLLEILNKKQSAFLVDIQKKNEYLMHHFPHSLTTAAYPVKSEKDRKRLGPVLGQLQQADGQIVIVGPRGKGAAKRTFRYFTAQGIAPERIAILEKGVRGWPQPELLLDTYGH
jgi:rhodanese-related sulfurtransferase